MVDEIAKIITDKYFARFQDLNETFCRLNEKRLSSMKYGLEDRVIQQIITVLKAYPAIEKAVLYGSRAKGNYKEGSDIDLCLFGKQIDLPFLIEVGLTLDELLLPYSFDLSAYSQLNNQDLISHIDRRGVVFFEKSEEHTVG